MQHFDPRHPKSSTPPVGFNSVGARAKIDLNPPVTLRRQAEIQHAAQSFGTNTVRLRL